MVYQNKILLPCSENALCSNGDLNARQSSVYCLYVLIRRIRGLKRQVTPKRLEHPLTLLCVLEKGNNI
jgi:hypothetical protein